MTRDREPALVLTDDEIALIERTIVATEIDGPIGNMLARGCPTVGGRRITGSREEFDALLDALFVEVNGYQRVEDENGALGIEKPRTGSTADKLRGINRKLEFYLM